jgi:hypothetical protein
MERKHLESAVADVTYLRGLLAVPMGLLWILTGLGNLRWGPFASNWVFVGCLAAIGAAALAITRYYNESYGRVTRSRRQQVRYAVATAIFGAAMVGGPIVDFNVDLPISVFAASFAVAMLALFAICVRLRPYHVVIWGALLVVGLLPVWGTFGDKVSVAWLPMGVATMAAGLFDHRALVRSVGSARDLDLQDSDVGA